MAETLVKRLETSKLMRVLSDDYYADLKQAPAMGRKVCWTVGPVPFELLRAMGVACQHLESYGAFVAARKAHGELKDVAHACNYSPDVCSYARITHGRRILEERGELNRMRPDVIYPRPDFVCSMNICPTMNPVTDSFARTYRVPQFSIEVPIIHDESQLHETKEYIKRQLEDFVSFLEEVTGHSFDYEQLRKSMILIKQAAALRMECIELCKHVPAPLTVFDMFISLGPINYLRGTPQSVDYYERLLAEVQERVDRKIGAVEDERHRLYWDNLPVWFKVGYLSEKLASLKANIVISQYVYTFWSRPEMIDPDRPLDTLAEEYSEVHAHRNMDWRIDLITKLVGEFSLDGLIMVSHRTCRPFDIGQQDMIEGVERRTGVPGIVIDGDPTDPDYYSDAQVDGRLQAFMEVLEARKKATGRKS